MSTILLTGATGMIGAAVGKMLSRQGYRLIIVSRSSPELSKAKVPFLCEAIQADLSKEEIHPDLLSEVDYVLHLAGESVATKRWTDLYKHKLIESRVVTTSNLRSSFEKLKCSRLKGYVGASAIGYYPESLTENYDESSGPGDTFLSKLVVSWEKEHQKWSGLHQKPKVTSVRLGVVHSYPGGALGEVVPLFKSHVGSALGTGKQWMSWVDLEDVCGVFFWLLNKTEWSSVYNVVSPEPVVNQVWSSKLAQALNVGLILNVPSIGLRLALGERASILLESQKVQPAQLLKEGYKFQHSTLSSSFQKIKDLFEKATHVFVAEQFVAKSQSEVFAFFSEAKNLEKISPSYLRFYVKSQSPSALQEGAIIDYRLKVRGVGAKWRSKILNWNPPNGFSDLQELGPYRYWFHTHSFYPVPGGTLIQDLVRYQLPFAPFGDWIAQKYVRHEIQQIFSYRQKIVGEMFSK